MATGLRRQESEVKQELKLALEEACLEAGVSLSPAISPSAWWAFDDNVSEPGVGELAGWLSITRRRSYRPSPLNKYRKFALDGSDILGEQSEEEESTEVDDSTSATTADDVENESTSQERSLKERLGNATELDVLAQDFNWSNLLSVHRTEHAESEEDDESNPRDSISSVELTVNSGGVVYFSMFQRGNGEQADSEDGNIGEAAAVFKFGSSRLATQSERLGIEIARHLGVSTPQARVIHSNSLEWSRIKEAVEIVKETSEANQNEIGIQTCEELLEALHLSRCMLIMGFIYGKPLAESPQAFSPENVALKTATALGRTFVVDLVLRNEDRLVCHELGWRGNPGNLLVTDRVPHASDKLGPANVEETANTNLGKPGFFKTRRSQSFTKLSTPGANELRSQLPKQHRAPSPDPTQLEGTNSMALKSLLVPESEATVLVKKEGDGVEVKVENNCLLVAIDSGVSRRPPKMKMEHDRRVYSKMIELLLNDEEIAANLLREISFGYLGPPFENEPTTQIHDSEKLDHSKITKAFQRGVVAGIHDMQILRLFLVKLFRTLDHLLRDFMVYMSKQGEAQGENITEIGRNSTSPQPHPGITQDQKPELTSSFPPQDVPATLHFESLNIQQDAVNLSDQKLANSRGELQEQPLSMPNSSVNFCTPSRVGPPKGSPRLTSLKISPKSMRKSPGSSPRLVSPNKISPTRDHWHEKGSPGRLTFKLKDVSKTAKIDGEVSKKLDWWDEKLREEGQKLCRQHGFTTGFLEGGGTHSLVDSYELKVRLEHILERITMISNGSDTERPSCVLPHLYIGGALAARSVHILQRLGITHILCLCPSDLESMDKGEFPDLFNYQHYGVKDVEDENISAYFEGACSFLERVEMEPGSKVLVHCFEGKSRSATVVLAYLMLRKGYTLAQAWTTMKAAHRRTQPNDGFMKTLIELDAKLHGKASMTFLQRRPVAQKCPICNKFAGLSITAYHQHFRRVHVGIPLPPSLLPNA